MSYKERYGYILGIIVLMVFVVGIYGSQKATEQRLETKMTTYQREVQALKLNYSELRQQYDSLSLMITVEQEVSKRLSEPFNEPAISSIQEIGQLAP